MIDSTKPSEPFLLGISGGSGSGKTYLASAIKDALGEELCDILFQDNFYLDQSHRFDFDGGAVNFDHPNALDFDRLAQCMAELKSGRRVSVPIYDFVTHKRAVQTLIVEPRPLIIVDGILIFHSEPVRDLFDERVFCHTDESVRYARRLARDVNERGRSAEGVKTQFLTQVKPMHDIFVEPTRQHAHWIWDENGSLEQIVNKFQERFGI